MSKSFLAIQGSYKHFGIALFLNNELVFEERKEQFAVSRDLINSIDFLLKKFDLKLKDLNFIAVDFGPGAFTTLRATIATINGISFSTNIPLVGVDGLDALLQTAIANILTKINLEDPKPILAISLLNAFNNDVYFSINKLFYKNKEINTILAEAKGYRNINELIDHLILNYSDYSLIFFGNGATLHKSIIETKFKNNLLFIDIESETATANIVGIIGLEIFESNYYELSYKLSPQYLKTQHFKPKYSV